MSFQPPRLQTFVRLPPGVRIPRNMKPPGLYAAAGGLTLVSGTLAAFVFADRIDSYTSSEKVGFVLAIAAAVVGGMLAIARISVGAPIAAGGVALFCAHAAMLVAVRVNDSAAFDPTNAKLQLAAGVLGVCGALLCLKCSDGRANAALGAAIALLAFVPAVAVAFLIHIDDFHEAASVGTIVGYVIIGSIILVGALKGRYGVLAAIAAAGVQVAPWIDSARQATDRQAAAIAALIAFAGVVVFGTIALVLAVSEEKSEEAVIDAQDHDALVAELTEATQAPVAPTSYRPAYASTGEVRRAAVVPAIAQPEAPAVASVSNAQWAPDPYGRFQFRYWNGTRWTDHVSTNGVTSTDPV